MSSYSLLAMVVPVLEKIAPAIAVHLASYFGLAPEIVTEVLAGYLHEQKENIANGIIEDPDVVIKFAELEKQLDELRNKIK